MGSVSNGLCGELVLENKGGNGFNQSSTRIELMDTTLSPDFNPAISAGLPGLKPSVNQWPFRNDAIIPSTVIWLL
jgi:hypothetical protein